LISNVQQLPKKKNSWVVFLLRFKEKVVEIMGLTSHFMEKRYKNGSKVQIAVDSTNIG
jgi:hypothetical protein